MAGGSRSNNRYNARRNFHISNARAQSLVRTNYRENHQQPREYNRIRTQVQSYERHRTIYVTFSVDGYPLEQHDIEEYITRTVGDDVAVAYYMDMPKQGWIVLSDEWYVDQLLGVHWIRNQTMFLKRYRVNTRQT